MTAIGCKLQNVTAGRGLTCQRYSRRATWSIWTTRRSSSIVQKDAVPPGPQAPQTRRPVRERLRRPRLIGELADSVPERSDTDAIVAEEARRLVESLNLPVDLIAHRDGMPRRRPASSCDT